MAIRLSDAAAALTIGDVGLRSAINLCKINFYTGVQPVSANDSIGASQPILTFFASGGLELDSPEDGLTLNPPQNVFFLKKKVSQVWSGMNGYNELGTLFTGIADGQAYTAGWGRMLISFGDTGANPTSGVSGYIRVDFSIGAANSDCIMLPTPTFLVKTTAGQQITSMINSFMLKINKNMN